MSDTNSRSASYVRPRLIRMFNALVTPWTVQEFCQITGYSESGIRQVLNQLVAEKKVTRTMRHRDSVRAYVYTKVVE